ncbi:peptidoglycan-binding protein LysM, partial [Allopusillimonas ginsengisoli]
MHRFASPPVASVFRFRPLAGALVLALALPAVHAATLGHSHLVSVLGQPLQINVQLRELTADDQRSLEVASAPAQAWAQSGLTPPVDPASLRFHVADGYAPGTKVIQVRSAQTFDQPVADLLLDVNTAAGRQRFQVSLLTQSEQAAIQGKSASAPDVSGSQQARATAAGKSIKVKWGDTMFSIAQQHAVPGVTVYQMMIALQRANPKAFINSNLNLVKSGATLKVPGMAALTAISDREARRLFVEQAQAFALYSQRTAGAATAAGGASAASGTVTTDADGVVKPQTPGEAPHDQLRLSGGANGSDAASANASADDALSARKGIEESSTRLSQLEGNVRDLNKALQAQGDAAGNLVLEGARSIGDTFSAGSGTQGAAGAGQVTANASSGSDQASTGQAAAGGPSAGAAAGKDGAPHDTGHNSVGSGQVGAGAVAAGAAASDQAGADNGGARVAGTADNTSSGVNATGTAAAAAGVSATNAGSGAAGSGAAGSGAAGSGAAGSGATGSGATGSGAAG